MEKHEILSKSKKVYKNMCGSVAILISDIKMEW